MSQPLKPLKWYKALATTEGRRETGCFLLEGLKAISQVILAKPAAVKEIVAVEGCRPPDGYPVRVVTCSQFEQISATRTPQGILAVAEIPEGTYSSRLTQPPGDRILLLEDVQDPGNVGTLIRTAAAFGFSGVILSAKCADPFSPKCVQSAAGSLLSVWLRRAEAYLDMAARLKQGGWRLVAATLDGESNLVLLQSSRLVIAMGSEACGLSQPCLELADCRFTIPMDRRRAESLNVAVSGGIAMYLSGI
ncbi:MAG: RNA methyltransferase [Dehalococcoidaceae bacterium]|nr:RNA methyltransferase [Dehalococcoidaceae bacterium]